MIFVCYRGWCDGSTPLTQTSTDSTIDNVIQLDCLNLSSMFMVQNEYSTKTKNLSKIQNSQAKHQNKRSITFFEHPKISVYRCVGYYPFYVISWRWSLLWCIWYIHKITAETHFHFALVHFVFGRSYKHWTIDVMHLLETSAVRIYKSVSLLSKTSLQRTMRANIKGSI